MDGPKWNKALESLNPYVFKISTPDGSGSGFQISFNKEKNLCGLATAYHVVDHANEWDETIKVTHFKSKKSLTLTKPNRVIFTLPDQDLAFIMFEKNILPLETNELSLVPTQKFLKQGVEIGWCGFPSIAPEELCFFEGYISCCLENKDYSYLVDGVAINGVSGGPVFHINSKGEPVICGVISAYLPNKIYGNTLPGVSYVRTIEPYQDMIKKFKSLNQAAQQATGLVK